jgi:hypothetical protein
VRQRLVHAALWPFAFDAEKISSTVTFIDDERGVLRII